ncbi:MAG: hypothetical protein HQL30_03905 [Candidatus Omnitrophica bacterium]|nr:hypothetical protein [Candidatus Omnitrophota bacterium]
MNEIIIDYIDNIKIDLLKLPMKNLHAINYLPNGLFRLAVMTKVDEGENISQDPSVKQFVMMPCVDPLISCAFHWFSTSLVNYVRLVGLIKVLSSNSWTTTDISNNKKHIKAQCDNYVETVIPEIKLWRNKIAAHFAATDPYENDNYGTLEQSVMNNVCSFKTRYYVNVFKFVTNGEESTLPMWSVTETYENLRSRYWPESTIGHDFDKCIRPRWHNFIPENIQEHNT